jgi:hypothetical protein
MALNARLYEPSVVAAARRLFPSFVGRAMRQHPDTVVAGFKYETSALLDSFCLAQWKFGAEPCFSKLFSRANFSKLFGEVWKKALEKVWKKVWKPERS